MEWDQAVSLPSAMVILLSSLGGRYESCNINHGSPLEYIELWWGMRC